MQAFGGDEDDRESAGSGDRSSDSEQDGVLEDNDDADIDRDIEVDADAENDEDNEEDDDEQEESQCSFGNNTHREQLKRAGASQASLLSSNSDFANGSNSADGMANSAPTSHPKPPVPLTSPSPTQDSLSLVGLPYEIPRVRPEVLAASVYDIIPTIAAPHSTSINSITATPDLRWVITGGSDGYIRKFNWVETANGKSMLTVAQRHPFVDSVTKAGVLMSYWENNEDSNGR